MNSEFDPLEAKLHRVLRSLPDQAAPLTLESRVLAALAERAALPWWRRSYAGWPIAVRLGFFILAGLSAAAVIFGLAQLPAVASAQSVLGNWRIIYTSLVETAARIVGDIPPVYFYTALAALGASYLALMGLGAAAYRTFFVRS